MSSGNVFVLLEILVLLHRWQTDKFSDFVSFIMSYRVLCGFFLAFAASFCVLAGTGISIVILATRTHKRITLQTQQKISRPDFVVTFFYG